MRYFLALVRGRNPTRAGRALGVDHTTVRRRLAALEASLNAKLIDTRDSGYVLTAQGTRLLESVEAMERLTLNIENSIADADDDVSGIVRISTSHGFGDHFLAERLMPLCDKYPLLRIELVTLPRIANISKREADIAIAPAPPERDREVIRKLTNSHLALFASAAYLERNPPISSVADLDAHTVIEFVHEAPFAPGKNYFPRVAPNARVQFESNSIVARLKAATSGQGIALLPYFIAKQDPRLLPVLPDEVKLDWDYWLVISPELRNATRVRVVVDFLIEEVGKAQTEFLY